MMVVTPSYVRREIETTDKLIRDAGHRGEVLFRPPYGKKLFALPFYLWRNNRKSITWDVEPESFPEVASNAERIADYVNSKAKPGSIIILHVMYPSREESMKSVKSIIEKLRTQGYEFKTVSELLALDQQ
jgi:chitin deacetylase